MSNKIELTQATQGLITELPKHLKPVSVKSFSDGLSPNMPQEVETVVLRMMTGKTKIMINDLMPNSLAASKKTREELEHGKTWQQGAVEISSELISDTYSEPFVDQLASFPAAGVVQSMNRQQLQKALKQAVLYQQVANVALDTLGHTNMGTSSAKDLMNKIREYVTIVILHMHVPKRSSTRSYIPDFPDECMYAVEGEKKRLGIIPKQRAG